MHPNGTVDCESVMEYMLSAVGFVPTNSFGCAHYEHTVKMLTLECIAGRWFLRDSWRQPVFSGMLEASPECEAFLRTLLDRVTG